MQRQIIFKLKFILVLLLIITCPELRASDCPAPNKPKSIENWRDSLADKVVNGEVSEAQKSLESCFGTDYRKHPSCLAGVGDYINSKAYSPSGPELNLLMSEQAIIKSPNEFPKEFLGKDLEDRPLNNTIMIPKNIDELAKKNGWTSLLYRTRSTGGFDIAPNLSIVAIPNLGGKNIDAYIQISPPPNAADSQQESNVSKSAVPPHLGQNHMTIITVDKNQNPPIADLRLLIRAPNSNAYSWSNTLKSSDCSGCHSNPLRPISPRGYDHKNIFYSGNFPNGTKETDLSEENQRKTKPLMI